MAAWGDAPSGARCLPSGLIRTGSVVAPGLRGGQKRGVICATRAFPVSGDAIMSPTSGLQELETSVVKQQGNAVAIPQGCQWPQLHRSRVARQCKTPSRSPGCRKCQ